MRTPGAEEVWDALRAVVDPELPFLTIEELGVLRDVRVEGTTVHVTITPTYSGCPAMDEIRSDIRAVLEGRGDQVVVQTVLSPAWTTDWMDEAAREKLRENGIAPPHRQSGPVAVVLQKRRLTPPCPLCSSVETEELSRFGSTSCKSLWRCLACREPFDHMRDF